MQQRSWQHRLSTSVLMLVGAIGSVACSSEHAGDPPVTTSRATLTVRSHADQMDAFVTARQMFHDKLQLRDVGAVEVTADGVRVVAADRAVPPGIVAIHADESGFVVWSYQGRGEGFVASQIWISADAHRAAEGALTAGSPVSISARHTVSHSSVVGTVERVERGGAS